MGLEIAMPKPASESDGCRAAGDDKKLTRSIERGAIFYKRSIPDGKDEEGRRRSLADVCP
jgi:hypothetical protein